MSAGGSSSSNSWKQFAEANNICDDNLYTFDAASMDEIRTQSPWKIDNNFFKSVRVSAVALLKMVMHCDSGGNKEVIGLMTGRCDGPHLIILNAFALPVEGTETRVSPEESAYEFSSKYVTALTACGRQENVIGWYHSHPSYGCWLSGIDVQTQRSHQQFEEPYVAIVIDPIETRSTGKITIGAFRTYPESYVNEQRQANADNQHIPAEKISDFGAHVNDYYCLETFLHHRCQCRISSNLIASSLPLPIPSSSSTFTMIRVRTCFETHLAIVSEVSFFKSELDNSLLSILWSKYWNESLSSSLLSSNSEYFNSKCSDIAKKCGQRSASSKVVNDCKKLSNEVICAAYGEIIRQNIFNFASLPLSLANSSIDRADQIDDGVVVGVAEIAGEGGDVDVEAAVATSTT